MARSKVVTRAEFEQLKFQHASLIDSLAALREALERIRTDLRVQFTRIAEMQAILDKERVDTKRDAPPVYQQPKRR
jgi:hypothetical protein